MKRKSLLFLAALMIALLLSGCGGQDSGGADDPAGAGGSADTEMVVGIPKITDSFDFYNTTNGFESISMSQIYDTLVVKDSSGQTVPSLAERFEISDDGKTYTFYLHQGVKFSNGKEFTAADAKYSIDQAMASAYTSWCYVSVDNCEIVDDYTIKLNMKMPNVGFLEYLANPYYSAMLSEETVNELGDQYGLTADTAIGTGPYILKEWKPGDYCVFEANPDYFKGEPNVKKVRLKTITDTNAAVIGLQTGEIHAYFNDIPGISYDAVSKEEKLNVVSYPSTIFFEIIMNTEKGPFADLKMRQAIAYAVDREQMLIVGAEGQGAVADYPGNRQGYTAGDPELKSTWYPVDLEKAQQLVKEAGMEGSKITIKTYATDPYPKLATILQDAMTKIGLNAEVQQMERGAFIDEALAKGDYEIGICRWAAGTKDIDEIMFGSLATESIGSPGNWSWYSNPQVDDLLKQAAGETDKEARKQLYGDVVKIYTEDVPQIPLYYPNGSRAYSKALTIEDGNVEYDRFYDYAWSN
ncbi:MAG: ABC transporter substrate-binding protein [Dehalobacterium sp.]|jgi:peptide/nickel transport system substrate-binding protein